MKQISPYGGAENWERTCLGYVLMRGDEILCEATADAYGRKSCLYEPGVFTQVKHRGRGYGTLASARLIQEIETIYPLFAPERGRSSDRVARPGILGIGTPYKSNSPHCILGNAGCASRREYQATSTVFV
jgi:hypothetical protein